MSAVSNTPFKGQEQGKSGLERGLKCVGDRVPVSISRNERIALLLPTPDKVNGHTENHDAETNCGATNLRD